MKNRPRPAPARPARPDHPAHTASAAKSDESAGERLQKILAHSGVASRRAAEEMIAAGRVSVNGHKITQMGVKVNPATDKIEVDGHPLSVPAPQEATEQFIYIAMNKPLGIVSTAKDPQGRLTVLDLLRSPVDEGRRTKDEGPRSTVLSKTENQRSKIESRVYPVGRLDADSTGLILLTNDGDLTFRLTHPRFGVEKEYRALVRGKPDVGSLQKMRQGVEIEGEMTAPAKVVETGTQGNNTWLNITIHEGKKRQVRLMCAAIGHHVIELQRVRFGPLALGSLQPGKWRHLATHEVHALQKAVRLRR